MTTIHKAQGSEYPAVILPLIFRAFSGYLGIGGVGGVTFHNQFNSLRLKTGRNRLIEAYSKFPLFENGAHEFSEHLMRALSLCIFDRSGRVSASLL